MKDTKEIKRYSSGAAWEQLVGYTRAVRKGDVIEVSGTTAPMLEGTDISGDPYRQSLACLEVIKNAVEALGGKMSDVVRTRVYVTDISQWSEIGRAHAEVFGAYPPASAMVEVSKLIHPSLLVEIEASAIVD